MLHAGTALVHGVEPVEAEPGGCPETSESPELHARTANRDRVVCALDVGEYTATGDNVIYRLEGVVAHDCRTKTLEAGGHFIAVVRKHDGRTFSTLNDNQRVVNGATIDGLYFPRSNKTDFKPYMLVYSKL